MSQEDGDRGFVTYLTQHPPVYIADTSVSLREQGVQAS
jgi:hypothetical protein